MPDNLFIKSLYLAPAGILSALKMEYLCNGVHYQLKNHDIRIEDNPIFLMEIFEFLALL